MTRFSVSVYMHSEIKHQFFIKNLISNWFPPKIHDFLRKHITERKRKMSKNWISSENSYTIYYLCRINKSKILKNWIDLSYCSRITGEIFFLQIFLCRKLGFGSSFNFFREKVKFYLVRKNSFFVGLLVYNSTHLCSRRCFLILFFKEDDNFGFFLHSICSQNTKAFFCWI